LAVVDTTGLIFVVVVVAWLVYLVPHHLARKTPVAPADDVVAVPAELTVTLHKGTPPPCDPSSEETTEDLLDSLFDLPVSTDYTRRAQRHAIRRMARHSADARRRSLLAGAVVAAVAVGVWLMGWTSWVTPVVAGGALLVGLVLARWNVVHVNRRLDKLRSAIDRGEDEATVPIYVETPMTEADDAEDSVELSLPLVAAPLSLWDPLPVPAATYVSQPMAPRTVRTIDLATALPAQPVPVVTAEGWEGEATEEISEAI
jgi:hypothetical protein